MWFYMLSSAFLFQRTLMLLGKENFDILTSKNIAIFGLGGVGSYVFEALIRCGIGSFVLVDKDTVSYSNINRQNIATITNIGKLKVDVAYSRGIDINPFVKIYRYPINVDDFNIKKILKGKKIDYIVDAIDDVKGKLAIIKYAYENNIKIISCMGTGNRFNPTSLKISDIYKTKNCPLAKKMRYILRKEGIKNLKVLYSDEIPTKPDYEYLKEKTAKIYIPSSISFVPPVAGLLIAYEVVRDILDLC